MNEKPVRASISSTSPASATFTSPAMNMPGILREAIKLPAKNKRLMLQVIFLVLVPISLLVLLHDFIAGPLLQKVEDSYERSALDVKDAIALVAVEVPFIVSFCMLFFFGMLITILASAAIHTAKPINLKELMLWIRSTWMNAATPWLHLSFLLIAFIALLVFSLHFTDLMGGSRVTFACSWVIRVLSALLYPYFASICTLGLIVSVLERDHQAKAFGKAQQLTRDKKLQSYLLMLILVLLSLPIYTVFYVTAADDDDELGSISRYAFMSATTLLFCLSNSFTMVAYTVFYFECKKKYGVEIELGPGFHLIASTVDSST